MVTMGVGVGGVGGVYIQQSPLGALKRTKSMSDRSTTQQAVEGVL